MILRFSLNQWNPCFFFLHLLVFNRRYSYYTATDWIVQDDFWIDYIKQLNKHLHLFYFAVLEIGSILVDYIKKYEFSRELKNSRKTKFFFYLQIETYKIFQNIVFILKSFQWERMYWISNCWNQSAWDELKKNESQLT